jgi:hypothetical protein
MLATYEFLCRTHEGTHADASGSGRILGFATTVAGMLVFALMIGVVSDSIGASVDDLKRGNAKVRHNCYFFAFCFFDFELLVDYPNLCSRAGGGVWPHSNPGME